MSGMRGQRTRRQHRNTGASRRRWLPITLAVSTASSVLAVVAPVPLPAFAAAIVVSGTSFDIHGDGICDLDEAIANANNDEATYTDCGSGAGADVIAFAIPGTPPFVIEPNAPLPQITSTLTIDGTSQPGYEGTPLIEITNVGVPAFPVLDLSPTTGSTVRGLILHSGGSFQAGVLAGEGSTIEDNWIGIDASGANPSAPSASNGYGVYADNKSNITIRNNVISGNEYGIVLQATDSDVEANGSTIVGNLIGTNPAGTSAVPNLNTGIFLGDGAGLVSGTQIGDGTALGRNVVSGNVGEGIALWGGVEGTTVDGNYIGTTVDGESPLGNLASGPDLYGGVVIRNFASGNSFTGNVIAHNIDNGLIAFSGSRNRFAPNNFFNNDGPGIELVERGPLFEAITGPTANDLDDPDAGTNDLQNHPEIVSAEIGLDDTVVVEATIDSLPAYSEYPITLDFYAVDGFFEEGGEHLGSTTIGAPGTATATLGSADGLDLFIGDGIVATSTDALGNTSEFSPYATLVGPRTLVVNDTGDEADAGADGTCDIGGESGICTLRAAIEEANDDPTTDTIVFAFPGPAVTTISPATDLPTITQPVIIDGTVGTGAACGTWPPTPVIQISPTSGYAAFQTFGPGALTARGLVINGDTSHGLFLNSDGNTLECNFIGTNAAGTAASGSRQIGVFVNGTDDNVIGTPGRGNVIAGAQLADHLRLAGADRNAVQGNLIGTDVTGAPLAGAPNRSILITGNDNLIGGTGVGEGNTISNAGSLYAIDMALGDGNEIRGNRISGNGGLGIDIAPLGVNFNHAGVVAGPNNYQNYPVLTLATTNSDLTATRVGGFFEGVPGRNYEIDIFANTACDASFFGEGEVYLGSFTAAAGTDGIVVFDRVVAGGLAEPAGITATATDSISRDTSEFSYCRPVSTANLNWAQAQLTSNGTVSQYITDNLQEKWFQFPVTPGATVSVTLNGLPGSAISLHRDPDPIYNGLTNPTTAVALSAQAADVAFLPSGTLPSGTLPSGTLPSGTLPSGTLDAYSSAARRSVMAVSMDPYAAVQTIERNTFDLQENLYVRVVGPYSITDPFDLTIQVTGGVCAAVTPITGGGVATPPNAGVRSVILTDSARIAGTAAEKAAALTSLTTLAARPEVAGVVVDLSSPAYGRVAQANAQADNLPGCPQAKNQVAEEIKSVIDAYRVNNPVEYVVLAGGANVIPFHQVQDVAGLANEREYVPPVNPNSPSEAGLRTGLVKGQDFYGSSDRLSVAGFTLDVPDLAVGRLVDSAADVSTAVAAYIATGGVVSPTSSLVTGYDFVGDAAEVVSDELRLGTNANPTELIQAPGESPSAPSAWTAAQLRTPLLSGNHDVVVMSGHFSAGNLLAADYRTTLAASEIQAAAASYADTIIFALGCHGGFSLPSSDLLAGASPDPDWAKAFLRKQAAAFVAATGYAYGDTELTEYGERLFVELTRQMRTGVGPVSMGQALVAAKRTYLAETAQITGIDEKTLVEMTLYGLPMMQVDMPGQRITPPVDATIVPGTVGVGTAPGVGFGLTTATASIAPTVTQNTVPLQNLAGGGTVNTTYLSGRDGVVVNPFEPVLPKQIENVSVAGRVLRGVALRGGTYSDTNGITPLTSAPTTETSRPIQSFNTEVFYPNQVWSPNFYDAIDGGATRVVAIPAQFRSSSLGAIDGTLRRWTGIDLALYYLPSGWPNGSAAVRSAAVTAAPNISGVTGSALGNQITFRVNALADGSAGVQAVWVLYTGEPGSAFHGTWAPLDLVQDPDDPTLWTGTLTAPSAADAAAMRFMVQAVGGGGLTTLSTNLGAYYRTPDVTVTPPAPAASAVFINGSPSSVAFGSNVTVSAQLAGSATLAGRALVFDVGGQTAIGITDAGGSASATITSTVAPGDYPVQVSFRGAADLRAATASSSITVTRQGTSVAITPASVTITPGQSTGIVATLTDSLGRKLGGKPIVFSFTTGTTTLERSVIADAWGDARLGVVDLPAGTYTVRASFGQGQTIAVADPNYSPSQSGTATLTIASTVAVAPVVVADMGVTGLQEIGFRGNVVVINGTYTDPDGTAPYRAWARWTPTGPFTPFALAANGRFAAAFIYGSAGTRTVTIRVCDAQNNCGTDDITVRTGISQRVTPVRQCVTDRGPGNALRYRAVYGYNNPAPFPIASPTVPLLENTFNPLPGFRGQPQVFMPGNQRNVFTVDFNGSSLNWTLHGTTVQARSSSPRC